MRLHSCDNLACLTVHKDNDCTANENSNLVFATPAVPAHRGDYKPGDSDSECNDPYIRDSHERNKM